MTTIAKTAAVGSKAVTVDFTALALENISETGVDWTDDYHDLVTGQVSESQLLAKCLECVDDDRVVGWQEYVWCLAGAARQVANVRE